MLVCGVAGGTGSGKTTLSQALETRLGSNNVVIISQDSYYLDHSELPLKEREAINYDHPDAFENQLLIHHLRLLRQGRSIEVPIYNFSVHTRTGRTITVAPRPVVIVEGILLLADENLRSEFDIKVFVDTDADIRLWRRILRDTKKRGRTLESVHRQYLATVKPMHDAFVEPSKRFADFIIPEGGHNEVALGLLASRLQNYLRNDDDICHSYARNGK